MRERGSGKREFPRGGEQERSDAEEPRGSQKTCSPNTPSACCGDRTNKFYSKDTPQLCCGEPRMRERGAVKREFPRGGGQERSDAEEPRGSQKTCSPNTPSACCGDRTNKFYCLRV